MEQSAPSRTARLQAAVHPPLPRLSPVTTIDLGWVLIGNAVVILAMWLRHGGLDQLATPAGLLTAAGQLTGLYAAYLALIQLVLMSRSPWLERAFGMDRLAWAHRWLGFAAVWLVVAHGLFITVGYALGDGRGVLDEGWLILTTYDWVLPATVGAALFVAIGITSVRAARSRLTYERWFLVHLLAYLGIALAFLHQLLVGADFMHDGLARAYWIAQFAIAFGLILAFRLVEPIRLNLRHRLRVERVEAEGPGVVSIVVAGDRLAELPVRSGQYFVWRFLSGPGWWHGHPFSISAAPNGRRLRITVKALGDGTRRLQRLRSGTRVWVEGPYGVLTGARRRTRRVALIAGGIGIAPLRALFEALPGDPGDLVLVYRARARRHLVLADELEAIARSRGNSVHFLVGRRGSRGLPDDPLAADQLLRLVPDLADRDVYLCGPEAMLERLERALRDVGVPRGRIHVERFAFA